MDEVVTKWWGKMIRAKCQYCKHFERGEFSSVDPCDLSIGLSLEALKKQKCSYYEWEDRLTKKDFIDYD